MLSKLKTFAALLGAFFVALGVAFLRGRRAGIEHLEAEQQRNRDALQQHYDEIDSRPLDPERAYERLRDRAEGRR